MKPHDIVFSTIRNNTANSAPLNPETVGIIGIVLVISVVVLITWAIERLINKTSL